MVHVLDYGLGNVQAFLNVYKRLGINALKVSTQSELAKASRIILPGVGAFDYAIDRLESSGMKGRLEEMVVEKKTPVLGICVGMQLLAKSSEEGGLDGLGWIDAEVKSFRGKNELKNVVLPHMGWNNVTPAKDSLLFRDFKDDARFYFLHSYYFDTQCKYDVAAVTDYGIEFECAIQKNNIYGVQFHPEKSHHWGALLLKNFSEA